MRSEKFAIKCKTSNKNKVHFCDWIPSSGMGKVMHGIEEDWPEYAELKVSAIRCKQKSNTNICDKRKLNWTIFKNCLSLPGEWVSSISIQSKTVLRRRRCHRGLAVSSSLYASMLSSISIQYHSNAKSFFSVHCQGNSARVNVWKSIWNSFCACKLLSRSLVSLFIFAIPSLFLVSCHRQPSSLPQRKWWRIENGDDEDESK